MKLKSVMNEYLDRNQKPQFLQETLNGLKTNEEFPCSVNSNSQWLHADSVSSRDFQFISREALRSFCEYVLDLEGHHGVSVAMSTLSDRNHVTIEVPHNSLSGDHFNNFFIEIDNINIDVVESFKNG